MVGKQLERDDIEYGKQQFRGVRYIEDMIDELFDLVIALDCYRAAEARART